MIIRYTLALSILMLSSCTLTDMITTAVTTDTGSLNQTGTTTTDSLDYQEPLVEDISGSGGMYYPIFDGLEMRTIRVRHETGVPTIISFINSEAKAVEVSISFPSTSGANLRWSQVVMPDGTMDGPFGQHVGYNLTQLGGYEFRFSENMMAGEPWSGLVDITLKLLDKPYAAGPTIPFFGICNPELRILNREKQTLIICNDIKMIYTRCIYHFLIFMTSQLLTRVPTELKRQFKARTREQGVSMDFLMNVFIRTYVEKPQIIQTYVEEEAFDEMIRRSFDTPKAKAAMESLFETIKSKGL